MGDRGSGSRAALILANADGSRLSGPSRTVSARRQSGVENSNLLRIRQSVEVAIARSNIVFVFDRSDAQHFGPALRDVPESNVVMQPENKGTAPAVLLALLRIAGIAPEASVVIFPSNCLLREDPNLIRHVGIAFKTVERRPEFTVLLAVQPFDGDPNYGWIEPAEKIGLGSFDLYRVGALWHRPDGDRALQLLERGCLWNSAVTVGRISTILGMIMINTQQLHAAFVPLRAKFPQAPSPRKVAEVYKNLEPMDFSEHVLGGAAVNLAALPVSDLLP